LVLKLFSLLRNTIHALSSCLFSQCTFVKIWIISSFLSKSTVSWFPLYFAIFLSAHQTAKYLFHYQTNVVKVQGQIASVHCTCRTPNLTWIISSRSVRKVGRNGHILPTVTIVVTHHATNSIACHTIVSSENQTSNRIFIGQLLLISICISPIQAIPMYANKKINSKPYSETSSTPQSGKFSFSHE